MLDNWILANFFNFNQQYLQLPNTFTGLFDPNFSQYPKPYQKPTNSPTNTLTVIACPLAWYFQHLHLSLNSLVHKCPTSILLFQSDLSLTKLFLFTPLHSIHLLNVEKPKQKNKMLLLWSIATIPCNANSNIAFGTKS